MRLAFVLLAIALCVTYVCADCEDAAKNPEDGELKSWLKNVSCQIKKGASDLSESAKPLAEKISNSTKDFGKTIAEKYDELKHKLTDDNNTSQAQNGTLSVVENSPSEEIPPAGEARDAAAAPQAPTGEQTAAKPGTPVSFDTRSIFGIAPICPEGEIPDEKGRCHKKV